MAKNLQAEDKSIISTADDAILAKLATVKAGYYEDPFLEPFRRQAAGITEHHSRSGRRQVQPIIKRGTHARVCCMDRAIASFINNSATSSSDTTIQVIVLGCGKDTSYFRHGQPQVTWWEVDHASVIQTKAEIIRDSPDVFDSTKIQKTDHGYLLTTTLTKTKDEDKIKSPTICYLVEHDLRTPTQTLIEKLRSTDGFDINAPTLVLLECVLMYIPEESSKEILQTLATNFSNAYLCCYEPILGSDAFGNVMEQNLVKAGVALAESCLRKTKTLQAQLDKVVSCGFSKAVGCDMYSAYETVMTQEQRRRANQCEFLDEIEEWMLIMRHYCFMVASTDISSDFSKQFCGIGLESALGFAENKCTEKNQIAV